MYTVFSVSLQHRLSSIAFSASSVQSAIASVQFLKHVQGRVCSIHSQWRSLLAGLQSTAFMVCLLLFSVYIALSVSSVSVAFRMCILFSGTFSVCTLQCLQFSEHWL